MKGKDEYVAPPAPKGYRKIISTCGSEVLNKTIYSVPYICQYNNVSIVSFNVDANDTDKREHTLFELDMGDSYDTWQTGGLGNKEHYAYRFTISPPLTDEEVFDTSFLFREYRGRPSEENPIGKKITIKCR